MWTGDDNKMPQDLCEKGCKWIHWVRREWQTCWNLMIDTGSIFWMTINFWATWSHWVTEIPNDYETLTLSLLAGHICPTYKVSFQVRWDNSIPLFLHAAIYLEVPLFRWTSQNAFSHVQMILCAMLLCSNA